MSLKNVGFSIQTLIYIIRPPNIIFLFAVAEVLCVPCEDDYNSNCIAKHVINQLRAYYSNSHIMSFKMVNSGYLNLYFVSFGIASSAELSDSKLGHSKLI